MPTLEMLAEIKILKERLKNSVEVVRCKDCRYIDTFDCPYYEVGYLCKDEDYCSKGERDE